MKDKLIIVILTLVSFYTNAQNMNDASKEVTIKELTDRIEINELINNYSRYADRRDPQKQTDLFTDDPSYT